MGKRGPKPRHDLGYGSISERGYHRAYVGGRLRMVHVLVWEQHHGAVPDGHDIHHRNEDKLDNRIENLECVDTVTHKRLHSGCQLRDGVWWKPCGVCGEFRPVGVADWYLSREGWPLYGRCRPCHVRRVVEDKKRRRAVRRLQEAPQP